MANLICSECKSNLSIKEETNIINCSNCHSSFFINTTNKKKHYYIPSKLNNETSEKTFKNFLKKSNVLRGLHSKCTVDDVFLAFIPFWRYRGRGIGLEVIYSEQSNKMEKCFLFQDGELIKPACPQPDIGIENIIQNLKKDSIEDIKFLNVSVNKPSTFIDSIKFFQTDELQQQGIIFEPTTQEEDIIDNGREYIKELINKKKKHIELSNTRINIICETLTLIYYPVWIFKYSYNNKIYSVVIDGIKDKILFAKAPADTSLKAGLMIAMIFSFNFIFTTLLQQKRIAESSIGIILIIVGMILFIMLWVRWGKKYLKGEKEIIVKE